MNIDGKETLKKAINSLDDNQKEALKKELYLDRKDKGILDAVQERVISRKLLVFIVSTVLLWTAGLDSDTWGMVAMMYIGGQSAIDFAKIWKG
jgi:hypothetical protein